MAYASADHAISITRTSAINGKYDMSIKASIDGNGVSLENADDFSVEITVEEASADNETDDGNSTSSNETEGESDAAGDDELADTDEAAKDDEESAAEVAAVAAKYTVNVDTSALDAKAVQALAMK